MELYYAILFLSVCLIFSVAGFIYLAIKLEYNRTEILELKNSIKAHICENSNLKKAMLCEAENYESRINVLREKLHEVDELLDLYIINDLIK